MILQIRTKDNLEELLKQGNSPAWVIAESRVPEIQSVEIYQFDGKRVLKADFDAANSTRTESDRLVVAFKNGVIEDADMDWNGQNPVRYRESSDNTNVPDGEKHKIITELKGMSQDESVFIALNVNNITEIRPSEGTLFNKKVSFEVKVFSDFAELESELSILKMIDLLEKKELADYLSSDFEQFSILSTGPGDKEYINIKWETPLTESEIAEMESIDLEFDSSPDQIESTKVFFERDSVTSITINCINGYNTTINL